MSYKKLFALADRLDPAAKNGGLTPGAVFGAVMSLTDEEKEELVRFTGLVKQHGHSLISQTDLLREQCPSLLKEDQFFDFIESVIDGLINNADGNPLLSLIVGGKE
jgi:3-deoxy-D-arabino-heptulosonate 7-phosphate (DAHP) synthase class II